MQTVLHVDRAGRRFGNFQALDDVSFEAQRGEITALLGPNGAGKTTLLRMALGLITPSSGDIRILGATARDLARAGGGRVASVGDGYEPPARTTLALLEQLQSEACPQFDRERFRNWISIKGLTASKRFGELSKGQKRWVLCGLAMTARADLVILDEPADGLDPAARRTLYDELRSLATDEDCAILITTHLLNDIERVADHVVVLDRGRVKLSAALEDLREEVREIDCNAGEFTGADHGVTVLARERIRDAQRVWIRTRAGHHTKAVGGAVRTVGLEELYLAMTGGAGAIPEQHEEALR